MLEVVEIALLGGEVKKPQRAVPKSVDTMVKIDKITKKGDNSVILDFTYSIDYRPKVAKVKITGQAFCRDTPANIKKMISEHKKKKTIPNEIGATAINMINANAGLNAVFLIRPFNLLPPFMPPMIVPEVKEEKKRKSRK